MRESGTGPRWAVALAAAALLWGCERKPPVEHEVLLGFQGDGSLQLRISTILRENPEKPELTPRLILPILDRYERGRDEWLLRMGEWGLGEVSHGLTVEEGEGEEEGWRTHTIARAASVRDPRPLVPGIFSREPVFVDLTWEDGLWTLDVIPQAEPPELRAHRDRVRGEVARLAEDIAATQETLRELYRYLHDRRDRRVPVLDDLSTGTDEAGGWGPNPLLESEEKLLNELVARAEKALDRPEAPVLDGAFLYPLEETLVVTVPGEAEGATGFWNSDGQWVISEIDLDELVVSVAEAPFDPRLLTSMDEYFPGGNVSPEAVLAAPFHVEPLPFADDIRREIWEVLARPGPYRLRWQAGAPVAEGP
jgi:hypothetical protein